MAQQLSEGSFPRDGCARHRHDAEAALSLGREGIDQQGEDNARPGRGNDDSQRLQEGESTSEVPGICR